MANFAVQARALEKHYSEASPPALKSVSFEIRSGEFVALVGKSGSGKSTLLNLLAGLDKPSAGELLINSASLKALDENQLTAWRGREVGIVFQFFQLLPTLTALENVLLPMELVGSIPSQARLHRAEELLDDLGLSPYVHRLPDQLSGGQQQRVAVARALANNPSIIVADEPTGNLDQVSGEAVIKALENCTRSGKTVILVTHDEDLAIRASRILRLSDGVLVEDSGAVA